MDYKCRHPGALSEYPWKTDKHNITAAFQDMGEYDKALEWYQCTLDSRETTLGKDHPYILTTVHNMAAAFRYKGRYDKFSGVVSMCS